MELKQEKKEHITILVADEDATVNDIVGGVWTLHDHGVFCGQVATTQMAVPYYSSKKKRHIQ